MLRSKRRSVLPRQETARSTFGATLFRFRRAVLPRHEPIGVRFRSATSDVRPITRSTIRVRRAGRCSLPALPPSNLVGSAPNVSAEVDALDRRSLTLSRRCVTLARKYCMCRRHWKGRASTPWLRRSYPASRASSIEPPAKGHSGDGYGEGRPSLLLGRSCPSVVRHSYSSLPLLPSWEHRESMPAEDGVARTRSCASTARSLTSAWPRWSPTGTRHGRSPQGQSGSW